MTLEKAGYDVAQDGSVTHGYRTDGAGAITVPRDNRRFNGDNTAKLPPLAD